MKTFEDLEHKKHFSYDEGTQAVMMFDNGYGVSVIRGGNRLGGELYGSYGVDHGLYELGVLSRDRSLTYSTPVTDDVVGYLTEQQVTDLMRQVQELPAAETEQA